MWPHSSSLCKVFSKSNFKKYFANNKILQKVFLKYKIKKYYFVVLFCSVHPASSWWATRWRHSVLSAASSLPSSQVMSVFFRLCFTMSVLFIIGRPGFLLYPFNSHRVAWWGILESSIPMTCPNHLSLRSLIMSSSFRKPVFFLISSFFTLSFHEIPNNLRWNLWCAASSFFICVTHSGHIHVGLGYAVTLKKRAIHIAWLLSSDLYPRRLVPPDIRQPAEDAWCFPESCAALFVTVFIVRFMAPQVNRNPRPLRFLHPRPSLQSSLSSSHWP